MTIWHVQKMYTSESGLYQVLPYDFVGTMKVAVQMKNGIRQVIKFLSDSRLTEKEARLLCKKKNAQLK